MKQNLNGNENGTDEIQRESENKECVITGNRKKWKRQCPSCNKDIYHTECWVRNKSEKLSKKCKSCALKGRVVSVETRLLQSKSFKGRKVSDKTRKNMSIAQTGRKHSIETRLKMCGSNNGMYGVYRTGDKNPFCGKKHDDESKRKMRIAMSHKIIKKDVVSGRLNNINSKEILYFEKLEKEKNWNGIFYGKCSHQFLLNELGYFIDYYEPNLNIVVEYDEPRHYMCGKLREKDIIRMNNIKNFLNCKFYRFNEKLNLLQEW